MDSQNRRLQLYQELLLTAKSEFELCESGDWEQDQAHVLLETITNKRQKLVDEIKKIESTPLTATEKRIIREILAIDEKSSALMLTMRNRFSQNLQKVKQGKRSTKAYHPSDVQAGGYFIDKKK